MNDLLNELLKAVLIAAIPILSGYLTTLIQSKSKAAQAGTNSILVQNLIAGAEKIVTDTVICTNQTFVDDLKKSGKFDEAAAKKAFEKTKDAILMILPQNTKDVLATLYGDFDAWLDSKIEATVKSEKPEIKPESAVGAITSETSNDIAEAAK